MYKKTTIQYCLISFIFFFWVAVVTPTDRPMSVRNRCTYNRFFVTLFVLSLHPFDNYVGIGAFVMGLSQISSSFLYKSWHLRFACYVRPNDRTDSKFWYSFIRYLVSLRYALLCIMTRLISDVRVPITSPTLTFNS